MPSNLLYTCMKRYIKSSKTRDVDIDTSMFKGTPFQCKTWMSYYDNFLNAKDLKYMQESKNRTGEIVMMTPEDYYWECGMYGFRHAVSTDKLKAERRANAKIEKYKNMMANGTKFPVCMLNKADNSQEGLHRMMAAGDLYGWNKAFPVLVITPYDQVKEDRWKLIDKAHDYRDDTFKHHCEWALHKISKWNKPVPENFIEIYRKMIFNLFNDTIEHMFDHIDIDFDIEVTEDEHPQVRVYLTKYGDYEFPDRYNPYEVFLEDFYDVNGEYQNMPDYDIDLDSELLL